MVWIDRSRARAVGAGGVSAAFADGPQSGSHGHVSRGLRFHPGRSDFPSPVGGPGLSPRCLPTTAETQALARIRPWLVWFAPWFDSFPPETRIPGSVPGPVEGASPPSAESPFAPLRCYPAGKDLLDPLGGRYPPSSLRQAHAPGQIPLVHFRLPLVRRVFAGCRQSLLRDGPSRRYLCNPCMGARTPYPAMSFRCSYPFLLGRLRPSPRREGIGTSNLSCAQLRQGDYFGAAVIR
jgi:hypothetical protein